MRYDDPDRPQFDSGGTVYPLHLSGAPMPSVTMIRPMQSQILVVGGAQTESDQPVHEWVWGWLCAIHAARGKNSFSHYYGWIHDMGAFQRDFFEDPEATLLHHFKWKGMEREVLEPKASQHQVIEEDIFAS